MRKLYLVKREDRIKQATEQTVIAAGLVPHSPKPGDIVQHLGEISWSRWLARRYEEETGLDYVFVLPIDSSAPAYLIPVQDVQEIPNPDDILSIIFVLQ